MLLPDGVIGLALRAFLDVVEVKAGPEGLEVLDAALDQEEVMVAAAVTRGGLPVLGHDGEVNQGPREFLQLNRLLDQAALALEEAHLQG